MPTRHISFPSCLALSLSLSRSILAMGPSRMNDRPFKRSVLEALVRSEASGSWNERANMTNATVYKELMQATQKQWGRHELLVNF
ncbi:hypothetical protein EI94DRAFT_1741841 [Lactarius quietus]|nr:hypothetical protein EI94DRAFT_1741841 [Lactarius quietus]